MSRLILTDLDDTILNCSTPLERFVIARLGTQPVAPLRDLYDVSHAFQISDEAAIALCQDFWESEEFGNLQAEPDAAVVLPRLYRKGYRFVGITACANRPAIVASRTRNLKSAFGFEFEQVFCTFEIGKAVVLKLFPPSTFVEDHINNAKLGAETGHRTFLLDRKHNRRSLSGTNVTRVTSWFEVENYLAVPVPKLQNA